MNKYNQHILITGSKNSGKTTLINNLTEGENFIGIKSYAVFGSDVKPKEVILVNMITGERKNIATKGINRMLPKVDVIETFGVKVLNDILSSDVENITIDEIGYLETSSELYCSRLLEIFEKKRVIACLRKESNELIDKIKDMKNSIFIDLDSKADIGCVVLAAGKGNRYGKNKLLEKINGKALIEHTLDSIPKEKFSEVVVVTAYEDVVRIAKAKGMKTIFYKSASKAETVKIGLCEMLDKNGCMIMVADQPFLKKSTLTKLIEAFRTNKNKICRLGFENNLGNPIIFPNTLFHHFFDLKGDSGGRDIINRNISEVIVVQASKKEELFDIDTKNDMQIACK